MMICKNCSFENEPDEKVCKNCGAPLQEDAVQQDTAAEPETQQQPADESVQDMAGSVQQDAVQADAQEPSESGAAPEIQNAEVPAPPKKRPFIFAFSGLIALALICVAMWLLFTGVFAPKYEIATDRSKFDVLYVKDDSIYAKPVSGDTRQFSGGLSADAASPVTRYDDKILQSEDGKTTYFLEGYNEQTLQGSLYVSYNNRDKVLIAEGVAQGMKISPDGKSVMYITNMNYETSIGELYLYKKGGTPELIANKGIYNGYLFSDSSKSVAYLENVNEETGLSELYFRPIGGEATLVDQEVLDAAKLSSKNEIIYLKNYSTQTQVADLYCWSKGGQPELMTSGISASSFAMSSFSAKAVYFKTPDQASLDLAIKNPGQPEETVMSNIMGLFDYDIENSNYLIAKAPEGADATQNPNMFLKKNNREAVEVGTNILSSSHGRASLDFNTIAYIDEYDQTTNAGKLHLYTSKWFGLMKGDKVVAENVYLFTMTPDGKTIAYMTAPDEEGKASLYTYKNGKIKHIADGITNRDFYLSQNGKTVIYMSDINTETNCGNLYSISTSGGGEATLIDSDVYNSFYSRSDKNAIYPKNFNEQAGTVDLYMWKGKGTPELIDTGVSNLLFEQTQY